MARYLRLVVLFAILAFAGGCARMPQADIDAARSTFQEAEAAQASTYAAGELALAKSALAELDVEVALQDNKSAISRKYGTAVSLAAEAKRIADEARVAAVEKRAELEAQVTKDLETLQREIASAENTLSKVLSMKRVKLDRAAFENEIDAVKNLADGAGNDISSGMLFAADVKIIQALEQLAASKVRISAVATERAR